MGNRVCVQFISEEEEDFEGRKYTEESPVVYNQWGGHEFAQRAKDFLLNIYRKGREDNPNIRRPKRLLGEFVQSLEEEIYLCNKGDNWSPDDAGFYKFVLKEDDFEIKHEKGDYETGKAIRR